MHQMQYRQFCSLESSSSAIPTGAKSGFWLSGAARCGDVPLKDKQALSSTVTKMCQEVRKVTARKPKRKHQANAQTELVWLS